MRLRLAALALLLALVPAPAGRAQEEPATCGPMGDYAFSQETLRDWVSFFDALSTVKVVRERRTGPLTDPDGAGVVGRRVTVKVKRTRWRRPGAPEAPRRFSFIDWGWWQHKDGSLEPLRQCGETRLEVGAKYLAIVGRHRKRWFAATTGRLIVRDGIAVGGVDVGRASAAHAALMGMPVPDAAAVVAATPPYRAAAAHPDWGPVARMQAAAADGWQ
jgi:hypothetical protein